MEKKRRALEREKKHTHTEHAQLDLKTWTKRMEVLIMITRKPNAIQNWIVNTLAALALADSSSIFIQFLASTLIAQETHNKPREISNAHWLFSIHAFFEHDRFFINQLLQFFFWQIIQFHFKFEWFLRYGLLVQFQRIKFLSKLRQKETKMYLIGWVIVLLQVRVSQRVLHNNSFVWVERQHLVQ